jgi:hypothetical protein
MTRGSRQGEGARGLRKEDVDATGDTVKRVGRVVNPRGITY